MTNIVDEDPVVPPRPPAGPPPSPRRFDVLDALRFGWGVHALARTDRTADLYGVAPTQRGRPAALAAVRVLGARDVFQATVLPATGDPRGRRLGAVVDALHVASMVPLAIVSRTWRRPALISAAATTLFAAGELRARRRLAQDAEPPVATKSEPVVDGNGTEMLPVYTVEEPSEPPDPAHRPIEDATRQLEQLTQEAGEPFQREDWAGVDEVARKRARITAARTRYILQRGMNPGGADPAAHREVRRANGRFFASVALVIVGLWLLFGEFTLHYPFNVAGNSTSLRDQGFAVIVTLAGLRLWWTTRRRPGSIETPAGRAGGVSSAVAGLCGVLLVASGLLEPHGGRAGGINEIACGVVAVITAVLARPRRINGS